MTPRNLATCLAPTLFYPSAKVGGMDVAMQSIGHALNLVDVSLPHSSCFALRTS